MHPGEKVELEANLESNLKGNMNISRPNCWGGGRRVGPTPDGGFWSLFLSRVGSHESEVRYPSRRRTRCDWVSGHGRVEKIGHYSLTGGLGWTHYKEATHSIHSSSIAPTSQHLHISTSPRTLHGGLTGNGAQDRTTEQEERSPRRETKETENDHREPRNYEAAQDVDSDSEPVYDEREYTFEEDYNPERGYPGGGTPGGAASSQASNSGYGPQKPRPAGRRIMQHRDSRDETTRPIRDGDNTHWYMEHNHQYRIQRRASKRNSEIFAFFRHEMGKCVGRFDRDGADLRLDYRGRR
ncbi:hypothetical protein B0H11DRAFT_1913846 [Mycena galericulata]|nr:hypothetical protein B0H11DRAFT_1913846 [Mycena galericulata]